MQQLRFTGAIRMQGTRQHAHVGTQVRAQRHVFQHGHARQQLHVLEGAADTQLGDLARRAVVDALAHERDLAARHRQHAADQVEGGALAGAVGANQAHDFTRADFERDVVDSDQPAEFLADGVHFQHHLPRLGTRARRQSRRGSGWGKVAARAIGAGNAAPPARQDGPQAIACVLQHQNQQHAEDDHLEVGVGVQQLGQPVLQLVFQHQDDAGAQQGAPDVTRATHHRHEQVFDAVVDAKRAGADGALHVRVEPARNAGQQGRPDEDHDLVGSGVHAHGFRHARAALQGADGAARTRIEQVAGGPQRQQHEYPDQVINVAAAGQGQAEDADGFNAGNAVVLAQPVDIAEQEVQRQAPRNGAQRQVVAGQAQGDRAQQVGNDGGQDQADRQRQPGRHVVLRGQERRGVGAKANKRGLAERRQAAHAGQQHQAQHDQAGQTDVIELRHPEFGRDRQQRQARQDDDEYSEQNAIHGVYSSSST
ncbi:hypothetical protein D3C73_856110 [compost metagenome]